MTTAEKLVQKVRDAKKELHVNTCRKFAGAAAAEILRRALSKKGMSVSSRDVFIIGVGLEIDLLVTYKAGKPEMGLLYKPRDVAVALEVKKSGLYGKDGLEKLKSDFKKLKKERIKCAYVSFEDRKSYKWRPTKKKLGGFECFTLAWHRKTDGQIEPTGDWEKLLKYLKKSLGRSPRKGSQKK